MNVRRPTRSPVFAEALERRRLLSGTTYYVSNTGNDLNAGTSVDAPWQTVTKVDATSFVPGDTILFQRGGQWRASLTASSDGSSSSPISYGAYGDPTAARPLFLGSDVLDPAAFTLVTGTAYSIAAPTAVHWLYSDAASLHEALDALTAAGQPSDAASQLAYVEATAGTFYYDATGTTLYVNLGGTLAGHTLEAATREDAVNSDARSFLAFSDLDVSETADDNAGYGFRIEGGADVSVTDCDATLNGKHSFGVIDTTGFVGRGLTASHMAPDAGFGGASAIAFFVDSTASFITRATASFTDCTFTDRDGYYPIMVSHGTGTDAIASLSMNDMVSTDGYGGGISVAATGPAEVVTVKGGQMVGCGVDLGADHSVIDGLNMSGIDAVISLDGTGDVVQNCLVTGVDPNYQSGHPASIIDNGTDNVVRLNTFAWTGTMGSAIEVSTGTTNTLIQGNIFAVPSAVILGPAQGTTAAVSDYNVFLPTTAFQLGVLNAEPITLATWQSSGQDAHSLVGDPAFNDASAGDYSLTATSLALDLAGDAPTQTPVAVTTDYAGNPRPYGGGFDAGALEYQQPKPDILGTYSITAYDVPSVNAFTPATAIFKVTLSAALTIPVTVDYATVDGTAHAGTDYTATTGTLAFPAGVTARDVAVPVTNNYGDAGDTFLLELLHPSLHTRITTGSATATLAALPTTSVGGNDGARKGYTDGRAKLVVVRLAGPGALTVDRGALGGDPVQIRLYGSTAATTMSITSAGAGDTSVGSIYVNGPLRALVAPTVNLTAGLTVTGAVGRITLGEVTGPAVMNLSGTAARATLSLGTVSNLAVSSDAPLGAVTAKSWSAAEYGGITAPSVASLSVPGTFGGDLNLSGAGVALGSTKLGTVTGGAWTVAGRAGTISAKSTASTWSAAIGGAVASVAVTGDLAGSLTAASLGTARVGGNLSAATVSLTAAAAKGFDLSQLRVGGTISGSTIRSAGNVNAITAAAIANSTVFVGVADTVTALPTAATDFDAAARLDTFTVTGLRGKATVGTVTATDVAAAALGTVRVAGVQTSNAGTPFGFATQSLAAYTDVEMGKKPYVWTAKSGGVVATTGDYEVTTL